MNNKKLGTDFEKEVCKLLQFDEYWVHFITPDKRGAQPFDIIAVKNGFARAIECKTLADSEKYFRINRIEENQKMAFEKWLECGNLMPLIVVKHKEKIHIIRWDDLKREGKINVDDR